MNSTYDQFPLVSVLINNYNYGRFLGEAIDSVLNQTYPHIEVIVVDDGSSDNSREVIASYGDTIVPVLKENGGQTSAANAGFAASNGDIICFLDSDDTYYPDKVRKVSEAIISKMVNNPYIMVYHLLEVVDKKGTSLGLRNPTSVYEGHPPNFYHYACKYKFVPFNSAPTSGISISRKLAERIFPLPIDVFMGLDDFIVKPAELIGEVYGIDCILGAYRLHGENNWHGNPYMRNKNFLVAQEKFLNEKLKANNKEPVISFFDSLFARNYYMHFGSSKDLLKLAVKVLSHHRDLLTIKFFLKTILLATIMPIKSLGNKKKW